MTSAKVSKDLRQKPSVLIADDEESIRTICARFLSSQGYEADTASDGTEALAKLLDRDYDIVLTDVKMPGLDGVELVEKGKAEKPYVEFIVMTAYASVDIAVKAMKCGAYDFLLKPLDLDQLGLTVERCYHEIQLREENELLRLANQRLRELHVTKEKFLAITSHELRTPVSNIKSFAEFLLSEEPLPPEERKQFYDILRRNLDELEQIVEDMHSIAMAQDGLLYLNLTRGDLNQEVALVRAQVEEAVRMRKQELLLELDEDLPLFEFDPLRIRRAIRELVQNAIKFTPDGGRIVVRTSHSGDEASVSVEDNGIGIPEHERERIFEKFYEVQDSLYHSTSKTAFMGGGLGLGLNIVKTIVEAHGGRVELESEVGKGSCFTIRLPLKPPEAK
ncbi:MAG: ATP-binding protein [candidate division KSB1 bacterium]|nr:ATP-binding protein [candidate division KSB1 bacterium]